VAKVLEKPVRQSAMVKRALKAEEDLKAGRVHSWDEVSAEMDQLIDSLYSEKKSPSRAGRSKRAV
jgi:MoxR-like ATPase